MNHQDWKTIVVHKPKTHEKQINVVNNNPTQQKHRSIEKKAENDELKHKQITVEMRKAIQQARAAKGFTQKELAQKCGFTPKILNEIESGKAIYNANHLNKIKKQLGVKF